MYVFIVNPKAGKGKAKRIFEKIKETDSYQQINSEYYFTKYPGHGEKIAREIARKSLPETIIVIGGDGTVHEVINGAGDYKNIRIAVIPGGSGNDFARSCGIKGNAAEIFENIIRGENSESYWIGQYTLNKQLKKNFVNSIGFGFDAQIANKANHSFYKHIFNFLRLGNVTYIIALIQVLIQFQPMQIELEVDGRPRKLQNCWMITCGNHPYYGGGMKIIPGAANRSDRISLIIIHEISKRKVITLFFTVFFGKHTSFKEVEVLEGRKIKVSSQHLLHVQVDGETAVCYQSQIEKNPTPLSVVRQTKK